MSYSGWKLFQQSASAIAANKVFIIWFKLAEIFGNELSVITIASHTPAVSKAEPINMIHQASGVCIDLQIVKNDSAVDHRQYGFQITNILNRNRHVVSVKYHQVGEFANL